MQVLNLTAIAWSAYELMFNPTATLADHGSHMFIHTTNILSLAEGSDILLQLTAGVMNTIPQISALISACQGTLLPCDGLDAYLHFATLGVLFVKESDEASSSILEKKAN